MAFAELFEHKLCLERLVIGLEEPILIKGIGQMMAKVDSGNDGYNVIHGENCYQQGDILIFTTYDIDGNKRQVSKKIVDSIHVHIGSGVVEERPVVCLNIKFANEDYKEVPFSVANRGENKMKVLISKSFVKDELDALIDVGAVGISKDGIEYEPVNEGAIWNGVKRIAGGTKELAGGIKDVVGGVAGGVGGMFVDTKKLKWKDFDKAKEKLNRDKKEKLNRDKKEKGFAEEVNGSYNIEKQQDELDKRIKKKLQEMGDNAALKVYDSNRLFISPILNWVPETWDELGLDLSDDDIKEEAEEETNDTREEVINLSKEIYESFSNIFKKIDGISKSSNVAAPNPDNSETLLGDINGLTTKAALSNGNITLNWLVAFKLELDNIFKKMDGVNKSSSAFIDFEKDTKKLRNELNKNLQKKYNFNLDSIPSIENASQTDGNDEREETDDEKLDNNESKLDAQKELKRLINQASRDTFSICAVFIPIQSKHFSPLEFFTNYGMREVIQSASAHLKAYGVSDEFYESIFSETFKKLSLYNSRLAPSHKIRLFMGVFRKKVVINTWDKTGLTTHGRKPESLTIEDMERMDVSTRNMQTRLLYFSKK